MVKNFIQDEVSTMRVGAKNWKYTSKGENWRLIQLEQDMIDKWELRPERSCDPIKSEWRSRIRGMTQKRLKMPNVE